MIGPSPTLRRNKCTGSIHRGLLVLHLLCLVSNAMDFCFVFTVLSLQIGYSELKIASELTAPNGSSKTGKTQLKVSEHVYQCVPTKHASHFVVFFICNMPLPHWMLSMRPARWNIQGLSTPQKRMRVVRHLKRLKTHVVLLQETHLLETNFHRIKRLWVEEVIYSPSSGPKAVVMILLHNRLQCTPSDVVGDLPIHGFGC